MRIFEIEFSQEADMFLSQAFVRIREESMYKRLYTSAGSAKISTAIFELIWPQALTIISVCSQSKSPKTLSDCLDGLKYILSSSVLLCRPNEIDSFVPLLAKITFSQSFSGTNEDLQRSIIKGSHLSQDWLSVIY